MRRWLIVAASCLPTAVSAQSVAGTIVDAGHHPLQGVVVAVLDESAAVRARALSDERGRFTILLPTAGSYRIRTTRIGYRPVLSEPIAVSTADTVRREFVLNAVPFVLDTIRAQGSATCRMTNADSALATWKVWEQVRTALNAGEATAASEQLIASVARYERTLDPIHRRVVAQREAVASDVIKQPWTSISADSLRRVGYVIEDNDNMTYMAPSLEMLSSDAFIEDHCFIISVANGDAIGIGFEPNRDRRKIPEIKGTAWVDTRTGDLLRIEYQYVNVNKDVDAEAAGQMEFTHLPNGAWAIGRWSIRMPRFSLVEGRYGFESKLVEYRVTGGELLVVTRVAMRDTLWSRPAIQLAGTVLDSATGRPVRAARITLPGMAANAISDDTGRFTILSLPPGDYMVQVRTPSLDSVNAVHQSSVMLTDSSRVVTLRVPNGVQLASRLCGKRPPAPGILVGDVRSAGVAQPNASVSAAWIERSADSVAHRHTRSVKADANGAYTFCGLPVDVPLTLEAKAGDQTESIALQIPGGRRSGRLTFNVEPVAAGANFSGLVLSDSTREPVAGVEVALPDLARTTATNDRGEFHIGDVAPGRQRVRIRRIGYAALEADVDFVAGRTHSDTVLISRINVLDSILVKGAARDPAMDDFDEHRHLGLGHFLTRDDLAKFDLAHTSDALEQVPGLSLIADLGGAKFVAGARGAKSISKLNKPCYSKVYLDRTVIFSSDNATIHQHFDVNSIAPSSIEAIEYYSGASQIPQQYMGLNTECGVLVIHTRR